MTRIHRSTKVKIEPTRRNNATLLRTMYTELSRLKW